MEISGNFDGHVHNIPVAGYGYRYIYISWSSRILPNKTSYHNFQRWVLHRIGISSIDTLRKNSGTQGKFLFTH